MTKPSDADIARYRRVRALFEELVDLDDEARARRLTTLQQRDPDVAREVLELLEVEGVETLGFREGLSPMERALDEEPTVEIPAAVGRYEIRGVLGRGGMGSVLDAWDPRLEREIALKILPPDTASSQDRLDRFEREAKALAALRHPGVVTVYSVEHEGDGSADDRHFFTMEKIDGTTLAHRLRDEGLPLPLFARWARELVDALAAAHTAGIVHRDLKPANVMVERESERVRLVDFGLVKRVGTADGAATGATASGMIMGTWRYMSPEQAKGESVDTRSDVFSLGVLLYEMLTGASPFARSSAAEMAAATLHETHPPIASVRSGVPRGVATVIDRCLEKDPDRRFADASAVAEALDDALEPVARGPRLPRALRLGAAVLGVVLAAIVVLGVLQWRGRQADEDFAVGIEAVEELQAERRQWDAYLKVQELLEERPDDEEAQRLLDELTIVTDLVTDPAGAQLSIRFYDAPDGPWLDLGSSPLEQFAFPNDVLVLRAELEGHQSVEVQYEPRRGGAAFTLPEASTAPDGMVRIDGGPVRLAQMAPVGIAPFWMDHTEVTNAEYERFVRADGYRRAEFWADDITVDGEDLAFEEVRAQFVDRTGRPGPATWTAGTYAEGEDDLPVRGVSWYEAQAYANFVGKRLPSLYHWHRAVPVGPTDLMARRSNLNSDGPVPVATLDALSPTGVEDLAGNVAEWMANPVEGSRYVIGGSWRDPRYSVNQPVRRDPADRSEILGFRCIQLTGEPDPQLFAELDLQPFDFRTVEPVSDDVFQAFLESFEPDPVALEPRLESSDETSPYWIREKVSFAASYGDERVPGHLFLPRRAQPPYQTVVYFPSGSALLFSSSEQLADLTIVDFLPRSGRAFFVPVYAGLYERRTPPSRGPQELREKVTRLVKDLQRAVDFVETRDDLDAERLAFVSISLGSAYAPIFLAVEPRFDVAVLIAGGFDEALRRAAPQAIQPWNYASRFSTPVLMINGRGDLTSPLETGQKPMFEMLTHAPQDKRHVVLEGGSLPDDQDAIAQATLEWLDRYLGPVRFEDS